MPGPSGKEKVLQRVLSPSETVKGRPFTSPRLYVGDTRALSYMLHDLKCLIDAGRLPISLHAPIEWQVNGLARRSVICDLDNLTRRHTQLCFVGFFGERRQDRPITPLEEANAELILEFRNFPGILSYSSMELYDGNWANLVIHYRPEDKTYWQSSERHAEAAQRLAPSYYRTVRIHNGVIPGGLHGGNGLVIQSTKYWDYQRPKLWQGLRDLTEGRSIWPPHG